MGSDNSNDNSSYYESIISDMKSKIAQCTTQCENLENQNSQLKDKYAKDVKLKQEENEKLKKQINKLNQYQLQQRKKNEEEEKKKKKRELELQEDIFNLGKEEEKRLLNGLKEEFLYKKNIWCYNELDRVNIDGYIYHIFETIAYQLNQTLIKYLDKIVNELKNINNITILNVQIIGKTGVGKSTLINSLLFKKVAKEGLGECCTLETKPYINKEKYPFLRLYDTRGIELSKDYNIQKVLNETTLYIKNKLESHNPSEIIHCLLYCLEGTRLEGVERELLIKIRQMYSGERLPIIIVCTRAIKKDVYKFEKKINKILKETCNQEISNEPDKISFIPILSKKEVLIDDSIFYPYGLDNLIKSCMTKAEYSIHSACITSLQYSVFSRIKESMEYISSEIIRQKNDFIYYISNGITYNVNNKADLLNQIFNYILKNYLESSGLIFENNDYSNFYMGFEQQIKNYAYDISELVNEIERKAFKNYEEINLKEIAQKLYNFECEKIIEKELNECFNVLKKSTELNDILKIDLNNYIKNLSVHYTILNSAYIFYDKINTITLTYFNDLFHKIIFEDIEIKNYISYIIGNKFDDKLKNNLNKLKDDLKAYQDKKEEENNKNDDEDDDD